MNPSEQNLFHEMKDLFKDFNCTLQDLKSPTEAFVTDFYTYWLQEFEVNIGTIHQTQFSQMQISNVSLYHDAYSSAIPKLNLLRAIRAFDVVPDFGMFDIVSPTPKRIQLVLRAFCDFYRWCDFRMGLMLEMKREMKMSERKRFMKTLLQERHKLQEQLNSIFIDIGGQLQDKKKELEGALIKYQQEASELRLQKEMLKRKSDEANERIKEKEAILHKLVKQESQITNMIKDYSNLVVDSPTTVVTDLETLRAKDREMKSLSDQKRDLVESKMKAQKDLEEVLAYAEELSKQLNKVLKRIEHHGNLRQIVSEIEKNTVGCQEELEGMKSSLMSIMSKKSSQQEELQAVNLKWKTIKDQLIQSLEAIKNELDTQNDARSKMITALNEDAKIDEKINSVIEKMKAHAKEFEETYQNLLAKEEAYVEKLKAGALSRQEKVREKAKEVLKKTKPKK